MGLSEAQGAPRWERLRKSLAGQLTSERVTERGGGEGGNLYFAVVGSIVAPPKKDTLTSCSPEPVTVTLFGKGTFACD